MQASPSPAAKTSTPRLDQAEAEITRLRGEVDALRLTIEALAARLDKLEATPAPVATSSKPRKAGSRAAYMAAYRLKKASVLPF